MNLNNFFKAIFGILLIFLIPITLYQVTYLIFGPSYLFNQVYYWLTFSLLALYASLYFFKPNFEQIWFVTPLELGLLFAHLLGVTLIDSLHYTALSFLLLFILGIIRLFKEPCAYCLGALILYLLFLKLYLLNLLGLYKF